MRQDSSDTPRRTPRPKRHLAVRMLVARLAWLDGVPIWTGDRIAWQPEDGEAIAPSPTDLARAQRCLHKIRQYPQAGRQVLGDVSAWLDARQARLEAVKRLAGLRGTDGARDLLAAEAVCVNALPDSPARALVAQGSTDDLPNPLPLASLVLGAIHRREATDGRKTRAFLPLDGHAERAYLWGLRRGLPLHPALVAALLADENGPDLAARCLAAVAYDLPLALSPETLRRLLAQSVPPAVVTEIAEAVASARPLAERLSRYRDELPGRREPKRRSAALALAGQRRQAVSDLARAYQDYALATKDPEAVRRLAPFVTSLLDLAPLSEAWSGAVLDMMREGLTLPAPFPAAYLTLLAEHWGRAGNAPPPPNAPKDPAKRLHFLVDWQRRGLSKRRETARSFALLLRRTEDAGIAGEALALNVHQALEDYWWADKDRYRWLLFLAASVPLADMRWWAHRFCELVDGLGDVAAMRSALHPLLTTLAPETPAVRALVWDAIWEEIGWERSDQRARLPRIGRYAGTLASFARQTTRPDLLPACVAGLLHLDSAQPDHARAWLDGLTTDLLAGEARGGHDGVTEQGLRSASLLASAMSGNDWGRFQTVFQACLAHGVQTEVYRLHQGLALLGRVPGLRLPLGDVFPRQPRRCVETLIRLGLLSRLGTDALAPLKRLEPQPSGPDFPLLLSPENGWWRLHKACPDLDADAARFRHACWVLGQPPALPPGLRQALGRAERLAGELAHLEAVPDRPGLGKRRDKLRLLLADPDALKAEAQADARERLPRLAAVMRMAALENQIQACYRARLEDLAGPLPQALPLTEDLINAVLLAADVTQNRRLLLRLLRAHLAGETRWREDHPDNVRFLQSLAARGVDAEAWQAVRPRRYPCTGAAGGRVHVWLERDPLHVLQMGNYFDTCLSADSFNAFSTVANACELNKRVVYARDGAGHVVGRKLIGIAEGGGLVGFRTYTSLTGAEANGALRAVFRHYLTRFASDCGLSLADAGGVPPLFAEAWYDDGTVTWNDTEGVVAAQGACQGRDKIAPSSLRLSAHFHA